MRMPLLSRRRALLTGGILLALVATIGGAFAARYRLASANAHPTLYVGSTVGADSSCSSPGYTSVQAAVTAAHSGSTVYLCSSGSPYTEQVIITKSLTLTGDPGVVIKGPASATSYAGQGPSLPAKFTTDNLLPPQAIVLIWGSGVSVTMSNITVDGPLPGTGGCASEEYGVLVISGATLTMSNSVVENIYDSNSSLYGCQFGVGVEIGAQFWPTPGYAKFVEVEFTGQATISSSTVFAYQKNGIEADGQGTHATITRDVVNGSGRDTKFAVIIGQNGMQISDGALANITYNIVSENSYLGAAPPAYANAASGILVFGGCGGPITTGTTIEHNIVVNNDVGIALANYVYSCKVAFPRPPRQPTNITVSYNEVSNDAVTNQGSTPVAGWNFSGYQAGISDTGNGDQITYNDIYGEGYASQQTPGGVWVLPIDVTLDPPINATVQNNNLYTP